MDPRSVCLAAVFGFLASGLALSQETRGRTVLVQPHTGAGTSHQWTDDSWLEDTVRDLSEAGGGNLLFGPGVYEFVRGVRVKRIHDVHFIGSPGTTFCLRPMPEFGKIRVAEPGTLESGCVVVDHPELMREGCYYQLFREDMRDNRILEFQSGKMDGSSVYLKWWTNAQIQSFSPGMVVVPALNFFDGWECSSITFSGITFDGTFDVASAAINGVRFWGHTLHCGILLRNSYISGNSPATSGLSVDDCVFRRLLGRGVTAYNMADIRVTNCRFEHFNAEGVEIDHLSTNATITTSVFSDVALGMRLNDCTDVIVSGNKFLDCLTGIVVTKSLDRPMLNERMLINGNIFRGGHRNIVLSDNSHAMTISANLFCDAGEVAIELRGNLVNCTNNTIVGCRKVGVRLFGDGCSMAGNVIAPATPEPPAFIAIERQGN